MDAKSEFLNSAIAESHWEKKSIEKLLINGSDECIYANYLQWSAKVLAFSISFV